MPMFNPVVPSGLTIGSTAIASGTTTKLLYDNAGVVAEANIFAGTNIVELRTSTSAQKLNVYNTYTDASNYAFGFLDSGVTTANTLTIGTTGLGTGATTLSKFALAFNGVNQLDYGVTSASFWTFAGNIKVAGANINIGNGVQLQSSANTLRLVNNGNSSVVGFQTNSDGVFQITNLSGTAFGRLQFGGSTSSFPALKQSAATIAVRLADDSADAGLTALYVKSASTTVAALTAAATAGAGARGFVTDATATTFLSTVAGGGANKVPVVSDGVNWIIG